MLKYIKGLEKMLEGKDENSVEYMLYKERLLDILESDLRENNPDEILNKYVKYFLEKKLKTICIKKDMEFYRGRIGKCIVPGAIDDHNTEFIMPYYGGMIKAAPPINTSGGRFNRAGFSYLYLATNLDTCFAEVHLQVGQECSIARFKCVENIELINLSDSNNNLILKAWYDIITQPVHDEIKYKYFITQFISDVLRNLNSNGLYFESVQANGHNIVCFKPDKFELINHSEKIYKAKKIKYEYIEVEDTIREFAKRNDSHLINDLNTYLVEENEKKIKYLNRWIKDEKNLLEK
ncbi:RES family NAD+ phosphorylase [Clostridium perfringens]|uniref:RES family NAD+ phosphorylase n=1 Tax=Clostridium perfringens TaxID=1502 RepID=UPI0023F6E502|nr:RES family NAD+ phosphorylase [Clostridium perfringens]MDM0716659.1 RES family NAD+ phosphorylase [Clostridium perfringens]MDU6894754.1 RES family NAD+ phosphorylase [Clostridium perfringens]MDU6932014.1 RES family NAD+ phosphorylase [Clostridium perfringens]WEV20049.1 RES family NAD+ phosphorylase [Clostridium perfringens D]